MDEATIQILSLSAYFIGALIIFVTINHISDRFYKRFSNDKEKSNKDTRLPLYTFKGKHPIKKFKKKCEICKKELATIIFNTKFICNECRYSKDIDVRRYEYEESNFNQHKARNKG